MMEQTAYIAWSPSTLKHDEALAPSKQDISQVHRLYTDMFVSYRFCTRHANT